MSPSLAVLVVLLTPYVGKVLGMMVQLDNLGITERKNTVIWWSPILELLFFHYMLKSSGLKAAVQCALSFLINPELCLIIPLTFIKLLEAEAERNKACTRAVHNGYRKHRSFRAISLTDTETLLNSFFGSVSKMM